MKYNDIGKRLLSIFLIISAFALSASCACRNFSDMSVFVGIEVCMGIFVMFAAVTLAFLPSFAEFYYNKVLGFFYHNVSKIKPREWYIRYRIVMPMMTSIIVLILINFIFAFI